MEIYDNKLDFRLYDRLAGGFIMAMCIHALNNFEENEERGKGFSEDDYKNLSLHDWNANNVRPETLDTCVQIVREFLDNAVTAEQKESLETLDEDEKLNFGNQLYIALLRKMSDAVDEEYQQAVEDYPAVDLVPDVRIGADGKVGITFSKR